MPEYLVRVLIAVSFFLALLGVACVTKRKRPAPRNVRRESGNTVPRQPNVRRAVAGSTVRAGDLVRFDSSTGFFVPAERATASAIARLPVDFPLTEPCWASDEITKVGGAA